MKASLFIFHAPFSFFEKGVIIPARGGRGHPGTRRHGDTGTRGRAGGGDRVTRPNISVSRRPRVYLLPIPLF